MSENRAVQYRVWVLSLSHYHVITLRNFLSQKIALYSACDCKLVQMQNSMGIGVSYN